MLTPKETIVFMSQEELAQAWHCDRRRIGWLRKYGLLTMIRVGKRWVTRNKDLDKFFQEYSGFDLSNETKIRLAKQIKSASSGQEQSA